MWGEFARFIAGGVGNTLATYALYLLLLMVLDYRVAYTVAYISGIFLAYWIGLRFVFRERSSWAKLSRFPIVYAVQYVMGVIVIMVCVGVFGAPEALAPLAAIALSVPITFLLSRRILRNSASGR